MLVLLLILIIPFWQLFSKAGYSGWWSLLIGGVLIGLAATLLMAFNGRVMVVPLLNLITLYVLAFSHWTAVKK